MRKDIVKSTVKSTASTILITSYLFLFGCGQNKTSIPEEHLNFDVIETDALIGMPVNLIVTGDTLLVNHYGGDEFMSWLSMSDGKIIKSDIRKGNGEREMLGPLEVNMYKDSILIFDRTRYRTYHADYMCDTLSVDKQELPFWVSQAYPLPDGSLLAAKFLFKEDDSEIANSRYAIIKEGNPITHFGAYPNFSKSDKDTPSDGLAFFYQTNGFCDLPNDRFAVTTSHVLSIYEAYNGSYRLVKEVQLSPYEYTYTPATGTMSATAFLKEGYDRGAGTGLAYHDGKIYVPYREGDSEDLVILCYDTDLNPLSKIIPATPIFDPFTIDKDGRIVALGEGDKSYIAITNDSM